MENNNKKKSEIKVVILGCSNSGKTCLISRYISNTFVEDSLATVSCSNFSKKVEIGDKSLILYIWDTPGVSLYLRSNKFLCKIADAIVLVYDITSKENFKGLKEYWKTIIRPNISNETSKEKIYNL